MEMEIIEAGKSVEELKLHCCISDVWAVMPELG